MPTKNKAKSRKRLAKSSKGVVLKQTLNFKVEPVRAKLIRIQARKDFKGNMTQMVLFALKTMQVTKKQKATLKDIRKTTRP